MSILIKKTQESQIFKPDENSVRIFSNKDKGGALYYMTSNESNPIDRLPVTILNYSELLSLYRNSKLVQGTYYLISDYRTRYEQPDYYLDGNLKSSVRHRITSNNPILLLATSENSLSPDAYQPAFPKDKIKYDINWEKTEYLNISNGRIIERIDEFNNRTDYDHRTIKFKRYQNYNRGDSQKGIISDYNCITGEITGISTRFLSLSIDSIILLNSLNDKGYNYGFKIKSIENNTKMFVYVDKLYQSGLPYNGNNISLNNGGTVFIEDYSFSGKSYEFYSAQYTNDYNQYKEVYFSQSDFSDFEDFFTFDINNSFSNYISDYSYFYIKERKNNTLVLPNNVFGAAKFNNITGSYYNNYSEFTMSNNISGSFYNNSFNSIENNIISNKFYDNNFFNFSDNFIKSKFIANNDNNSLNFQNNTISGDVIEVSFDANSPVFESYTCNIFTDSLRNTKLSYYTDILSVVKID